MKQAFIRSTFGQRLIDVCILFSVLVSVRLLSVHFFICPLTVTLLTLHTQHPVIRLKLAHMTRQVEATHSWLENITYQMNKLKGKEKDERLAGPITLLKAQVWFVCFSVAFVCSMVCLLFWFCLTCSV